ncbi:AAA family ATPase [Rubinisphaera italica]|uniref:AAA+ ATPase domain-containing protein n=1 Tax=Rubinisphaera italica TaxID=2527969 RepID=A0A5C5XMQ2_9PLAN|nr:AAA family ATPase [Rubinisphaera italica]TWT64230.1 hypothetical protein Pan54_49910 [Rubinisphaera italica]
MIAENLQTENIEQIDWNNDPDLKDPDSYDSSSIDVFEQDEALQQTIAVLLIKNGGPLLAGFCKAGISPKSFVNNTHALLAEVAVSYFEEFGDVPPREVVVNEIKEKLKDDKNALYYLADVKTLYDYFEPNVSSLEYCQKKLAEFQRLSLIKKGISEYIKKPHSIESAETLLQSVSEAVSVSCVDVEADSYALGDRIDNVRPEWLVSKLIRRNQISCMFGSPGCRKTWLAIDLALSVATGTDFLGSIPCKKGKVWYIAAEGADDFELRAEAIIRGRGIERPSGADFQYRFIPYDFSSEAAVNQCIKHIENSISNADLIVIDTLSKNFSGDGDNNKEIGKFINSIEKLRLKTGAHIMTVHHTGWSQTERERGASNLRGGIDTSILVDSDQQKSTLVCKKQKSGIEFDDICVKFGLQILEDYLQDGEAVTGLVGYFDNSTDDDQFTHCVLAAFGDEVELNQSELVDRVKADWLSRTGANLGVNKTRKMLDDLSATGSTIVKKKGLNNASIYSLIGGNPVLQSSI